MCVTNLPQTHRPFNVILTLNTERCVKKWNL